MTNNHNRHSHPGARRNCKICRADYMRKYRRIVGLTPEQRFKMNARSYAHSYLKRGKIERRPCFICNTVENLEFHHPDYNQPLMTISLCHRHHVMLTFKRLCLIPKAVDAFWEFERASRSVTNMVNIERIVNRLKRSCAEIKTQAASA